MGNRGDILPGRVNRGKGGKVGVSVQKRGVSGGLVGKTGKTHGSERVGSEGAGVGGVVAFSLLRVHRAPSSKGGPAIDGGGYWEDGAKAWS